MSLERVTALGTVPRAAGTRLWQGPVPCPQPQPLSQRPPACLAPILARSTPNTHCLPRDAWIFPLAGDTALGTGAKSPPWPRRQVRVPPRLGDIFGHNGSISPHRVVGCFRGSPRGLGCHPGEWGGQHPRKRVYTQRGVFVPKENYLHPRKGVCIQRGVFVPEKGVFSPKEGCLHPKEGCQHPSRGCLYTRSMLTPNGEVPAPNAGGLSPQGRVLSARGRISSQRGGCSHPRGGVSTQRGGVAAQEGVS